MLTEPDRFAGSPDDSSKCTHAWMPIVTKTYRQCAAARRGTRTWRGRGTPDRPGLGSAGSSSPSLPRRARLDWSRSSRFAILRNWLARSNAGAQVIGVNNRNLETLHVDPDTVTRMIPTIPASVIAVAESGVRDVGDVERAAATGADAVLVGSSLSMASDPAAAVRALAGVPRRTGIRS